MTRIDAVEFEGKKIVPIKFLQRAAARSGVARRRTTPARRRSAASCEGIKDGKPKRYFIYNICDHAETYKEVRAQAVSYTTGVPAVTGAVMMVTGQVEGRRRVQHGAARSRSVPRRCRASAACPGTSRSVERRAPRSAPTSPARSTSRELETPCFVTDLGALEANLADPRRRPAARGLHDPARAQGLRAVVDVPARPPVPRRRDLELGRRGAARARGARRRGPRLRARVLRGRDARAGHARRSHRAQLARAVAAAPADRSRPRGARADDLVRAARQPRAPGGRGRALRSRAAPCSRLGTTRANLDRRAISTASTACTSTRCARSTATRSSARSRRSSTKFGDFIPRHEVGQLRRRPPHHAPGLRRRAAGRAGPRRSARAGNVAGLPRARRGDRARHRRARRVGDGHVPQRHGHRDPRHLGHRAHARRARDAVPPGDRRRRRPGREAAHLPARRPDLPRRRRDRRLQLRPPARARRQARVPRHGALHDGQDHDLQRRAPAVDRDARSGDRRRSRCTAGSATTTTAIGFPRLSGPPGPRYARGGTHRPLIGQGEIS